MRKVVAILFACTLGMSACNQSADSPKGGENMEDLPANAQTESYEDEPEMVKVTLSYADGNISAEGDYLNGKKAGSWTEFHPNGVVKSVSGYVNGLKQGAHIEIDNTGRLVKKAYYHQDQLHGVYKEYKLARVKEERIYKNGALNGLVKIYYDNGSILEESLYVDGKRHGLAKWYDQEGNVTIEYEYDNGDLVKK